VQDGDDVIRRNDPWRESGGGGCWFETIGWIRREHFVQGKSIKEIVRDLNLPRNPVRNVLGSRGRRFHTSAKCSRARSWGDGRRNSIGCWRRTPKRRRASGRL
jgi:hypothetical protein